MSSARMPHLAMFDVSSSLHPMNEKVQIMANSVYSEFEGIIGNHGNDAVKGLMPLVVNILESLDQNLKEKQQFEVDLELSKVECEHLTKQFEKEKFLRRSTDSKFLETEDLLEETKKQLSQLKNITELSTKRLEMRIRNLQDQVGRQEEKEQSTKEEYTRLHYKYSDLLKNHADLVHKSSKHHHEHIEHTKRLPPESLTSTPKQNHCSIKLKKSDSILSINSLSEIPDTSLDNHSLSSTNFYSLQQELENEDYFPTKSPTPALIDNTNLISISLQNSNGKREEKNTQQYNINTPVQSILIKPLEEKLKNSEDVDNSIEKSVKNVREDNISDLNENSTNTVTSTVNETSSKAPEILVTSSTAPEILETSSTAPEILETFSTASKILETSPTALEVHETPTVAEAAKTESNITDLNINNEVATVTQDSNSASQEDLSNENKNNNVDALFGECMLASNGGIIDQEKYLESMGQLLAIEEDSEGKLDLVSEEDGVGCGLRKNLSLYEELSVLDDENDIISVGVEVDKLIQENSELMATKNALNVLKDDLISEVEELSGEVELLREEVEFLHVHGDEQDQRIIGYVEEVRRFKEEMATLQRRLDEKERSDKDTFSRIELVRVLMERNQYKEKLMELQEAVRWAETMRAKKAHPEMSSPPSKRKNSSAGVWGMFNSFLGLDKPEE